MSNYLALLFTSNFSSLPNTLQQEVYKEYYRLVYPLIYYIFRDHQATEDVIQESFLRAIDKSSQLQDIGKLEGWLKTMARNVSLNVLRKFNRNRNELGSEDVYFIKEQSNNDSPLEQEVEAKMLQEAIKRYVRLLKPEYRQLLEMKVIGQMSYKEMAAAVGTSESIVKQRLFRAREAVKQKLQEEWGL